jgi:hypothetical protein
VAGQKLLRGLKVRTCRQWVTRGHSTKTQPGELVTYTRTQRPSHNYPLPIPLCLANKIIHLSDKAADTRTNENYFYPLAILATLTSSSPRRSQRILHRLSPTPNPIYATKPRRRSQLCSHISRPSGGRHTGLV